MLFGIGIAGREQGWGFPRLKSTVRLEDSPDGINCQVFVANFKVEIIGCEEGWISSGLPVSSIFHVYLFLFMNK